MIRAWVQASRPLAQANIAVPLLFGQALAWNRTGSFDLGWLVLIHVFGVLDQLLIVFANDVADADGDPHNEFPTPFSGGSRVLVEGKLSRTQLAVGASVCATAILGVTVFAAANGRPYAPWFAVAAIGLLWAYSFDPFRWSYRGHGEWLQAFGVGAVLPTIAYYLQVGNLTEFPWWVLFPSILLGYAGNVLTAIPDTPSDRRAGKRTLAVRFGSSMARNVVVGLVAIAGLSVFLDEALAGSWRIGLIGLVGVGALVNAVIFSGVTPPKTGANQTPPRALLWFVVWNGGLMHTTLLVWSAGLVQSAPT